MTKTRTVWHHQVRGLDVDCAPWIPPSRSWESFNTQELRAIVTDAVKRRNMWNRPEKMHLIQKAEVAFDSPDEPDEANGRMVEPRVLPGGERVLIVRSGTLELWDVPNGRHLWSGESPGRHNRCSYSSIDVIENGRTLMIAAKFRTSDDAPTERCVILIDDGRDFRVHKHLAQCYPCLPSEPCFL